MNNFKQIKKHKWEVNCISSNNEASWLTPCAHEKVDLGICMYVADTNRDGYRMICFVDSNVNGLNYVCIAKPRY